MPSKDPSTGLCLDNQFAREVQGMYVHWQPEPAPAPRWLQFNDALALELGLDAHAS